MWAETTLLIISVLVFLGLREFFCWYFKINEHLQLQRDSLKVQKEILNELKFSNSQSKPE